MAFYGPTSSKKWAPLHRCIYLYHRQACTPCDRIGYGLPCKEENVCMRGISVEEALAAFLYLVEEKPEGQVDFCGSHV